MAESCLPKCFTINVVVYHLFVYYINKSIAVYITNIVDVTRKHL